MHWQIIGTILGVAALLTWIGYALGPKLALRLAKRETARTVGLTQKLTAQLTRTLAERDTFERRAEEYRKVIETILKERDGWMDLYDKQSIGHGNAQGIMMDAICHLEQKLKAAGVTVELPGIIRETQDLYLQAHVLPAVQRTGSTIVHRGEKQPNSAPADGKDAPGV